MASQPPTRSKIRATVAAGPTEHSCGYSHTACGREGRGQGGDAACGAAHPPGGSSHTMSRRQNVIMHSSHTGSSSPTGSHSVIWRRAQRSAGGQRPHTTQSSSGIGMARQSRQKSLNRVGANSVYLRAFFRGLGGGNGQPEKRLGEFASASKRPWTSEGGSGAKRKRPSLRRAASSHSDRVWRRLVEASRARSTPRRPDC